MLWIRQDEVEEASECNQELSNEATDEHNTIIGGVWIANIVNLELGRKVCLLGRRDDLLDDLLLEQLQPLFLPKSIPLVLPLPLGIFCLLLFPQLLFLKLLTPIELFYNALLVVDGNSAH